MKDIADSHLIYSTDKGSICPDCSKPIKECVCREIRRNVLPETSGKVRIRIERDFGEQPIAKIMVEYGLKPNDLVRNSTGQISHKMVARAAKGRRLTPHV